MNKKCKYYDYGKTAPRELGEFCYFKLSPIKLAGCIECVFGSGSKIPVQVKRLREDAVIPQYAHAGDAGFDLVAVEGVIIKPGETKLVPTGLAVSIPEGYEIQIRPRSGKSLKTNLRIANAPGTIDSGYKGEVGIIVSNIGGKVEKVDRHDKIAQGVIKPVPTADFVEVAQLDGLDVENGHAINERGVDGFGSTDGKEDG